MDLFFPIMDYQHPNLVICQDAWTTREKFGVFCTISLTPCPQLELQLSMTPRTEVSGAAPVSPTSHCRTVGRADVSALWLMWCVHHKNCDHTTLRPGIYAHMFFPRALGSVKRKDLYWWLPLLLLVAGQKESKFWPVICPSQLIFQTEPCYLSSKMQYFNVLTEWKPETHGY